MTTGRAKDKGETVVWCLAVLEGLTIISGDSRGRLSFWDGKLGAQVESYQSHRADILSLAVSDDKKTLYCAGVDPNITSYVKVNVKGENQKWVKSIQRKIHDHDVRALLLIDDKVYSGGVDGYLACSYYPPKTLLKYPPFLQNPCASVSKSKKYILLKNARHIELWSLGAANDKDGNYQGLLTLKEGSKKLLHLHRTVKDDSGEQVNEGIASCALSNDGTWLAYSTNTALRVFRFHYVQGESPVLTPVENLPEESGPCVHIQFTSNSAQLILALRFGGIQIFDLQDNTIAPSQSLDVTSGWSTVVDKCRKSNFLFDVVLEDIVTCIATSACSKYLAVADAQSNIAVWENRSNKWIKHCKLPKYNSPLTCMSIQPKGLFLVVAYADQKVKLI